MSSVTTLLLHYNLSDFRQFQLAVTVRKTRKDSVNIININLTPSVGW
jgi:hypothetical protein